MKALIDLEDVKKRLSEIVADKTVARKVESQHQRIKELESTVGKLRHEMGSANTSRVKAIRKEQNVVLRQIDKLSKTKIEIVKTIKNLGNKVLKYIEIGMIPDEVLKLVGPPRLKNKFGVCWNYGRVWIDFSEEDCIYKLGFVRCISSKKNCKGEIYKKE